MSIPKKSHIRCIHPLLYYPDCTVLCSVSTWYSGQPPHDKAHWNTDSLSKNDSWKCFDNPKIVNSNNKIFEQHFCKYESKLPGQAHL